MPLQIPGRRCWIGLPALTSMSEIEPSGFGYRPDGNGWLDVGPRQEIVRTPQKARRTDHLYAYDHHYMKVAPDDSPAVEPTPSSH